MDVKFKKSIPNMGCNVFTWMFPHDLKQVESNISLSPNPVLINPIASYCKHRNALEFCEVQTSTEKWIFPGAVLNNSFNFTTTISKCFIILSLTPLADIWWIEGRGKFPEFSFFNKNEQMIILNDEFNKELDCCLVVIILSNLQKINTINFNM